MTFSTGLSSLRAHQTALSVVGNNIANASTEGYRRQEVLFVENPSVEIQGLTIGTGVSIADIRSAGSAAMEQALIGNDAEGAMLNVRLATAEQIESLFIPGTGTLQERAEDLFLNLERLSALPADASMRASVVHSAIGLAEELNRISSALDSMATTNEAEIGATIESIVDLAEQIGELNQRVTRLKNEGGSPDALIAKRDRLVRDLATLVDVDVRRTPEGHETFVIAGGLFSVENGVENLEVLRDENGKLEVWKLGCIKPYDVTGGKLGGLLAQNNDEQGGITGLRNKLDEFTSSLFAHLDGAHATGVGMRGAFSSLTGNRPMGDNTATLASLETAIPVSAGRLYISVNNMVSDTSELVVLDIDPQTQSLQDIATLIDGVDHLAARTDSNGRLSITSEPGFTFDFTGNLQTYPDTSGLTGTSEPTVTGRYTGEQNADYSLQFIGSGTIGVTPGLRVEVTDSLGQSIRWLDVGTDYEPSSPLLIGDGIEFSLSSGTVVDGETFEIQAPSRPDETGILAALGLNTLFSGKDAHTIEVNMDIVQNHELLATTTNGEPSDTRNLHRMLALRDTRVMGDGSMTMDEFLNDIAADAGREVVDLTQDVAAFEENAAFLQGELDAVTGVDVNEELTRMLQYQRAYQAAARYISTIDQTLQQLFAII